MILPWLAVLVGCVDAPPAAMDVPPRLPAAHVATAADPFEPLPQEVDVDPRRVALGARLFADPALSGSGTRACTDCHVLERGGIAPGEARSDHPLEGGGPYNVPTVFNAAFNFRLNWQGVVPDLDQHFAVLMMNPRVMDAGSWPALIGRLAPYTPEFVAAGFSDGVTEASIRAVMVDYQRSLVTPDSPFDRSLRGEEPLPPDAARGYALFKELGCASCHQGMNVGGNLFQRYGIHGDPFDGRVVERRDHGRILLTGDPGDEFVFRVPSLRNVAVTAPYFHDGSAPTLDAAVRHMGRVQLGYELDDDEAAALVAFLGSLTGEYQGVSLAEGAP